MLEHSTITQVPHAIRLSANSIETSFEQLISNIFFILSMFVLIRIVELMLYPPTIEMALLSRLFGRLVIMVLILYFVLFFILEFVKRISKRRRTEMIKKVRSERAQLFQELKQ